MLHFFAEHMLFYASEKYPVEDSYSKYIAEVCRILLGLFVSISLERNTCSGFNMILVVLYYWAGLPFPCHI
jgi:hypothetical protein